jgi:hypothetical protein
LAERRWSDAQMKELGGQLEKLDFISGLQIGLHGERVSGLGDIDFMKTHRDDDSIMLVYAICPRFFSSMEKDLRYLPELPETSGWLAAWVGQLLPDNHLMRIVENLPPAGWYDLNKVTLAKTFQEHLFQICQPAKHLISQQVVAGIDGNMQKLRQPADIMPLNAFAFNVIPAIYSAAQKIAQGQNAVDMAIVACALERYHLAQGKYPETLAVLAPEYAKTIPPDVVDGQPLHYRLTQDGRYMLYSVGWDGKDDGGVVALKETSHWVGDQWVQYPNDWVWQYSLQIQNSQAPE